MLLTEKYAKRIQVSEAVCKNNGTIMTENKKVTVARLLENSNKFLNEAFGSNNGTQRADLGVFKRFTLDMTTVAVPNLIAHDIVLVKPMSSITGYIQYVKFVAGETKGDVSNGDVINDPFRLGKDAAKRIDYTGDRTTDIVPADASSHVLVWTPVIKGVFEDSTGAKKDVKIIHKDGSADTFENVGADGKTITATLKEGDRIAYVYDNIIVPQNKIPTLRMEMAGIPLMAKARRIAIFYSQMAAFQYKTELGGDINDVLSTQACAELTYEIDSEIVKLLDDNAKDDDLSVSDKAKLVFNAALPVGVDMINHYAGIAKVLAEASKVIYKRTQKHSANYAVISSDVLPYLTMIPSFKGTDGTRNGPYLAGTLNGLKIFVSPILEAGRFFVGFHGGELNTSAAVYAPYMPLVPTSLLQFADGGNSQGFSTMYDLVMLNKDLLVPGKIVEISESGATAVVRG